MAYCTVEDLNDKLTGNDLIALTDDEGNGTVVTERAEKAVDDASAEIDAYCQGRYTVPLTPKPPIITKYCSDIAVYNLYQRRMGAPDHIKADRDSALQFLKGVSTGSINLEFPPAETLPPESAQTYSRPQIFGPDTLDKY